MRAERPFSRSFFHEAEEDEGDFPRLDTGAPVSMKLRLPPPFVGERVSLSLRMLTGGDNVSFSFHCDSLFYSLTR